jgi:hypothetical protein
VVSSRSRCTSASSPSQRNPVCLLVSRLTVPRLLSEAVQICLEGIDRNAPLTVEPSAAVLLIENTVRNVADILALSTWPAKQLRLVVERWHPDVEVRIERVR